MEGEAVPAVLSRDRWSVPGALAAGTRGPRAPSGVVLGAGARVHPTLLVHHPFGWCPCPVVGGFAPGTQPVSRAGEYSGCGVVWCGVVWCGVVRCGAVRAVWCAGVVLWHGLEVGCLPSCAMVFIPQISPDGHVTTIAGDGHKAGSNVSEFDGRGEEARFRDVRSMTSDADGSLYVVDGTAIRRVSPAGDVATLAFRCNDVCKAIAIDGDGNFLVVEGRALIRFARDGVALSLNLVAGRRGDGWHRSCKSTCGLQDFEAKRERSGQGRSPRTLGIWACVSWGGLQYVEPSEEATEANDSHMPP